MFPFHFAVQSKKLRKSYMQENKNPIDPMPMGRGEELWTKGKTRIMPINRIRDSATVIQNNKKTFAARV
jgi:hypothetical protein